MLLFQGSWQKHDTWLHLLFLIDSWQFVSCIVVKRLIGPIIFSIQIGELEFKISRKYGYAKKFMVSKELIIMGSVAFLDERMRLHHHWHCAFTWYGESGKQKSGYVLPLTSFKVLRHRIFPPKLIKSMECLDKFLTKGYAPSKQSLGHVPGNRKPWLHTKKLKVFVMY